MPLDPTLTGRTFPSTPAYPVNAEKIAEFAAAIGDDHPVHHDPDAARAAGHPDVIAPLTFPIVVAFRAMEALLHDPAVGISLHRVVHGEQRFVQHRPTRAGDVISAALTIESVRSLAGADILTTRSEVSTLDGEPVCTAVATLVHRSESQDP